MSTTIFKYTKKRNKKAPENVSHLPFQVLFIEFRFLHFFDILRDLINTVLGLRKTSKTIEEPMV